MQQTEFESFATLIFGLGEYYGKPVTAGVVNLYWDGLAKYEYSDISIAVQRHLADPDTGQFMPKISDIVRAMSGGKGAQALVAWSKVDKAVRRVGNWQSVCFDDAIIHRVIDDMGGWIGLCSIQTEKEFDIRHHEFVKRYQGYMLQGGVKEFPAVLIGSSDAYNIREKYQEEPKPLYLGDPGKARAVHLGGGTSGFQIMSAAKAVELLEQQTKGANQNETGKRAALPH